MYRQLESTVFPLKYIQLVSVDGNIYYKPVKGLSSVLVYNQGCLVCFVYLY